MDWQELKDDSLESLVEVLQMKDDAESLEWAQAAFINLTLRYRKDLLEKCTRMCHKNGLTETDAEEITNRAFESLFEKCAFTPSRCKVADIDKCFRFYLYAIARHEFADYLKPDESPYTGEEKIVTSMIDPNKEYESERLSQLKEAEASLDDLLSSLSPKHKIIFLTYQQHENEGRKLPRKLLEELRTVLNLSQSAIRVYKKEAYDLVKSKMYGK